MGKFSRLMCTGALSRPVADGFAVAMSPSSAPAGSVFGPGRACVLQSAVGGGAGSAAGHGGRPQQGHQNTQLHFDPVQILPADGSLQEEVVPGPPGGSLDAGCDNVDSSGAASVRWDRSVAPGGVKWRRRRTLVDEAPYINPGLTPPLFAV